MLIPKHIRLLFAGLFILCTMHSSCLTEEEPSGVPIPAPPRPPGFSRKATLINFGTEEDWNFAWAEHTGPYKENGKEYAHIQGFKFYYETTQQTHTFYYENIAVREGKKIFDFTNCSMLNYPGEATIEVANENDTISMFCVKGPDEFSRVHKDVAFTSVNSVSLNQYNEYAADFDIEINLQQEGERRFVVTTNNLVKTYYRLCDSCKIAPGKISFINREDGRIYFLERHCYLEPENAEDAGRFKQMW